MRHLAIGDIHGDLRAFDRLIEFVGPTRDDLVVTLGDYVDRGLDSAGVLDRLCELQTRLRLVAIRGNHDQLMLASRGEPDELEVWKNLGGDATLASYPDDSLENVPSRHWALLEALSDYHETDTHLFVHAHVDPDEDLDQQDRYTLHWRPLSLAQPHRSGKVVVCGHTPQESGRPANLGHTVCVDTHGWLTCVDVLADWVWQVGEDGAKREYALPAPQER